MISYSTGTVFNSNCKWVVNTVNCDGVMGAGIALEFRLRYPNMFEKYKMDCKNGLVKLGKMHYYEDISSDLHIINFPTKYNFKFPSEISWIEEGLKDFVKTYKSMGITDVAFTKLGCGKGGLDWNDVKQIMEKYLKDLDINVVICLDSNKNAEGKEKEMVENFNELDINSLPNNIRLNSKQKEILENLKPLDRFYKIEKKKGIGKITYEKLFKYLYDYKKDSEIEEQLSLI